MIKVKKGPKPQILVKNGSKWNKEYCKAVKEYEKTKNGKKPSAKYNKPTIKQGVMDESHDKCVFCESQVSHVYYGDIEHFRPKSKYCRYAHTWSNLLYACNKCNNAKKAQFPKQDPIVKPTKENPEKFFEYDALPGGNLVRLVPLNERAENSINIMTLNRDELNERRGERWFELESTVEILRAHGVSEKIIEDHINPYKENSKEYAGMFRYFF